MVNKLALTGFILLIGILIFFVGLMVLLQGNPQRAMVLNGQSSLDPKNCSYTVEGKRITLQDGYSEIAVPGFEEKHITRYFGNEAFGDFNQDGFTDSALIIKQNSGGTGTFSYVVAALGSKEGCKGTNGIYLGDRIAPQATEFRNGEIIINYADRKPGEPMTQHPTIGISRYFAVDNNRLVESSKNILNLSNQELTRIPSSVFSQIELEELNVSENSITGAIQAEIRNLVNLKVLNLSNNAMTGVPAEIGQLKKLEILDLSYNQLTGLPQELGNLQQLKTLNLVGNEYSVQDLEYIQSKLPKTTTIITN